MDKSLPPIPADLWPNVPVATTHRLPCRPSFYVEVMPLSEGHLLTSLSRSIHSEMQCAGEWAARTESVLAEKGMVSPQTLSRRLAEGASRLLSIYTALYNTAPPSGIFDESPDAIKKSAAHSYQIGFRNEREFQRRPDASFNDDLYVRVNPNAVITRPSQRPPHR